MSARLANKTALVTGATSNIGRAIAIAFAAEGAHVAAAGRSQERGREVIGEIGAAGGRADFLAAHLDGSARASEGLAQEAARVLGGRIDVLVNSAGIYPGLSTAATGEAIFDEVYAVNVKAPFFLVAAIAPAMAEQGSGAIINLLDRAARHPGRLAVQLHQGCNRDADAGLGSRIRPRRGTRQRHLARRDPAAVPP